MDNTIEDNIDMIANLALLRIEREYNVSQQAQVQASVTQAIEVENDDDLAGILSNVHGHRDVSQYARRLGEDGEVSSDDEGDALGFTDNDDNQFSADEGENLAYAPLIDDTPDEEFSEFVSAVSYEANESSTVTFEGNDHSVSVNAEETGIVEATTEVSAPTLAAAERVSIAPLSEDKIAFIKSAMSSFKLKPRFGAEQIFQSLQFSHLRVGDEPTLSSSNGMFPPSQL